MLKACVAIMVGGLYHKTSNHLESNAHGVCENKSRDTSVNRGRALPAPRSAAPRTFFFFWLHPRPAEVSGPGIKSVLQQQPRQTLNPLSHRGAPRIHVFPGEGGPFSILRQRPDPPSIAAPAWPPHVCPRTCYRLCRHLDLPLHSPSKHPVTSTCAGHCSRSWGHKQGAARQHPGRQGALAG